MLEKSILKSVKKTLMIDEADTAFDQTIITHINSVFGTLHQLGIGPVDGYMIEDDSSEWGEFLGTDIRVTQVRSYMFLRLRLIFDPPSNSFAVASFDEQRKEMEWRLNAHREEQLWPLQQNIS